MCAARRVLQCLIVLSVFPVVRAQALSSTNWFVPAIELAPNGRASSSNYVVVTTLGALGPGTQASKSYRILGGYPAMLDVSPMGRPWITAVRPETITTNGGANIEIFGANLHLGSAPTIRIGDKQAHPQSRSARRIVARQAALAKVGRQRVSMSNSLGSTAVESGLAVLPLVESEPPAAPLRPFSLAFRGHGGDLVVVLLGIEGSFSLPIQPFLHGLSLVPASLIVLHGLVITAPDGVARLPFPALNYVRPIHVQALFLSANQGYRPGSFSNVLGL